MAVPLPRALLRVLADPARGLRELERLECEAGLLGFTRHAWRLLEPGRRFVPGWHLEVLCDHLEAVTRGEITRLLINVPPGAMKSLTVAVLWPAWEWGPAGRPELRTIAASYSERLSLRDNMKCRRLVASAWYRGHWGRSVRLVGDQNAKGKFENARTGFRLATSVGGLGTGERGDRLVIDDPHNVQQAESAAVREATLRWFSETVPTRLNDSKSAIIVVMQRVHERDVSGLILAQELGYEHLMLPMRFEPKRACVTSLGPADRRRKAGELLWPERFPEAAVRALEQAMGSYAAAGQFQQRPAPRDVVHGDAVHVGDRERERRRGREERRDVARRQRDPHTGADRRDRGGGTHGAARGQDHEQVLALEDTDDLRGARLGVAPTHGVDVRADHVRRDGHGLVERRVEERRGPVGGPVRRVDGGVLRCAQPAAAPPLDGARPRPVRRPVVRRAVRLLVRHLASRVGPRGPVVTRRCRPAAGTPSARSRPP